MQIQVGPFQFYISEPFAEGHLVNKAEARALNALRAQRIRIMLAKRVAPEVSRDQLEAEAQELDRSFKFHPRGATPATSEDSFLETLREVAEERAGQSAAGEVDEKLVSQLMEDEGVKREAQIRFRAMVEATQEALQELAAPATSEAAPASSEASPSSPK